MCKLNLNSFKHVVMCWSYVIYCILFEWFEFELKKRVIRRAFRFIVTEHGFSGAGFPVIPPGGLERLRDAWLQRHTAFVAKPTKFPSQRWTKHINRWDVMMCHDVSWCWWGGLNMSGSMDMSGHGCDQANGSKKFKYIPMFEILYMMVAHIYWYSIWRDCFTFPLNSSQVVDFAWIYTSGARWRSVFRLLWVVSGLFAYT